MRASEADILIIPGLGGSGPEHWQSRWEAKLPLARRVIQKDWDRPELNAWRGRIIEEVERAEGPVIFVAHSLGVLATMHATPFLAMGTSGSKVKGGLLVAPPSAARLSDLDELDPAFLTRPNEPLAFHAILIAVTIDILPLPTARLWPPRLARSSSTPDIQVTSTAKAGTAPGQRASCVLPDSSKHCEAIVTTPEQSVSLGLALQQ